MSATVELAGLDSLNEGINRLVGLLDGRDTTAFDEIGALGESFIKRRLHDEGGDYESGGKWADLQDWYAEEKKKTSSGGILTRSGDLETSIDHQVDGAEIIIGTNDVKATTMHYGAKKGEFGKGAPWGDIPARPFLGFDADEAQELLDILNDHIDAELKR